MRTREQALQSQIIRLKRRVVALNQLSDRYSSIRSAYFLVGILIGYAAFRWSGAWWGGGVTVLLLSGFILLIHGHQRVKRSLSRHRLWLTIQTDQLARIRRDWGRLCQAPATLPSEDHPFGSDLDLVGTRSLHQLINTAASRGGSELLRDWLLSGSLDQEAICERQALVRELSPLTLFRTKLRLHSALVSPRANKPWEGGPILKWLTAAEHSGRSLRASLLLLGGLSVLNIILFTLSRLALLPNVWLISALLYVVLYYAKLRQLAPAFWEALDLEKELERFRAGFRYLETQRYGRNRRLAILAQPFINPQQRPSLYIKGILRVMTALGVRTNPFLWIIFNALFPWDIYFCHRLNYYKARLARLLPRWLQVWYELEALCSLANFAYLNPECVFPQLVPPSDHRKRIVFQARRLGHPLIPAKNRICNDFTLNRLGEIALITGSNMAGKSTFLRTIGINLALAYAGGPVNAAALHISSFRLYTCIKISDSVTDGLSYFYAEVRRLKRLLSALEGHEGYPLFFLIDEIFKGTNNRERLVGSRSYLRELVRCQGLGIIATHDLELVKLADELPQIKNFHFREEIIAAQMRFDYLLRPGPCPTTNALEIMRLAGLPLDDRDHPT